MMWKILTGIFTISTVLFCVVLAHEEEPGVQKRAAEVADDLQLEHDLKRVKRLQDYHDQEEALDRVKRLKRSPYKRSVPPPGRLQIPATFEGLKNDKFIVPKDWGLKQLEKLNKKREKPGVQKRAAEVADDLQLEHDLKRVKRLQDYHDQEEALDRVKRLKRSSHQRSAPSLKLPHLPENMKSRFISEDWQQTQHKMNIKNQKTGGEQ